MTIGQDDENGAEIVTTDLVGEGPSRTRRYLIGAVVALLVVGGVGFVVQSQGRLPDDAVFRHDDRVYRESDLDRFLHQQQALYGAQPPELSQDVVRRAAAQSFAGSLVVDQAAQDAGVSVSDAEVASAEQDFIARTYPSGRESFIEALASEGVSEQDVLGELRRQLLVAELYERVTEDAAVSPSAVAETYRSSKADFAQPESRLVSEIVAPTCRAARVLAPQVSDARSFARVARNRSLDSTTAGDGGSLGYVVQSQLEAPFGAAAFAAEPGVVFGPVRAQGRAYCYLGIVLKVRAARTPSFEEIRADLTAELTAARGLELWKGYVEDRIQEAAVEYADRYRPRDPDAVPDDELPSSKPTAPTSTPGASSGP